MRNTRWGDIAVAFQDLVTDFKSDQISALKNRKIVALMTYDEIFEIAAKYGFNLISQEGYTNTMDFLRKEAATIVPRIKTKNTRNGYKYIFYNFNLLGDIYPIQYINGDRLAVIDDYWTRTEIFITQEFTLDPTPDDTLDSVTGLWIIELDQLGSSIIILRDLLISYAPKFVENATEFMSKNTLRVLLNDVKQMKRATEIPYFEHQLVIPGNLDKTINIRLYNDYTGIPTASTQSLLIGSNLSALTSIQLGNSSHAALNASISGVVSLVETIPANDNLASGGIQYVTSLTANQFWARKRIVEKQRYTGYYTELALQGPSGTLFYSKFPKIQWDENMNYNIMFKVTLA